MTKWVFKVYRAGNARKVTIPREVIKLWNDPIYVIVEYDVNSNELRIRPLT